MTGRVETGRVRQVAGVVELRGLSTIPVDNPVDKPRPSGREAAIGWDSRAAAYFLGKYAK